MVQEDYDDEEEGGDDTTESSVLISPPRFNDDDETEVSLCRIMVIDNFGNVIKLYHCVS